MKIGLVDIFRIVPLCKKTKSDFSAIFHIDVENIQMKDVEQIHVVKPLRSSALRCGRPHQFRKYSLCSCGVPHMLCRVPHV